MRQRVALLQTTLFGDQLVASSERHRLECDERDLLRILECKADDRSDLVVVDTVDQGGDENDVDAGFVKIVDRTKFHIEQVSDLTMRVCIVTDSVELQIHEPKSGFSSFATKFFRLRELDTVRRGLHRVVS